MEELITEKAGYLRCDVCGRAQDLGRRMQGCWDCDYHVCSSCEKKFQDADWYASWFAFWHGKQPKEVQKDEGADMDSPTASTVAPEVPTPRCPGKHTLYQYFVPEDPPLQCDVCGKRLAPYKRIWGCSSCDFDIGPCCQQKFQDPEFMQSWQTFWCLQGSLEEEVEPLAPTDLHGQSSGHPGVDSPVPAAVPKPEVAQVELPTQEVAPEGPKVAPEGPKVAPEGPKVTRPKPIRLHIPQEELQKTQQESSKAMVLGGKNEVVAPALMKAVLKKESSVEKSQTSRDPAVLKFARKGATVFTPEETGEPRGSKEGRTSVVPEEAQEGEKKSKKKKKDDKEKSEKSEKKEKKHKKEGKEGRDGDEEGAEKRATRREKKSRREMQSRREQ